MCNRILQLVFQDTWAVLGLFISRYILFRVCKFLMRLCCVPVFNPLQQAVRLPFFPSGCTLKHTFSLHVEPIVVWLWLLRHRSGEEDTNGCWCCEPSRVACARPYKLYFFPRISRCYGSKTLLKMYSSRKKMWVSWSRDYQSLMVRYSVVTWTCGVLGILGLFQALL